MEDLISMGPTPDSRTPQRRTVFIGVLAAVIVAMLAVLTVVLLNGREAQNGGVTAPPSAAPVAAQPPLYVSPDGRDTADGASPTTPLATIQAALEKATPGTTINLAPGVYHEQPTTVRDGAPGAPITIKGPETGTDRAGRYQAVLYGTGRSSTSITAGSPSTVSPSTGRSSWEVSRSPRTCARSTPGSRASRTGSRTAGWSTSARRSSRAT